MKPIDLTTVDGVLSWLDRHRGKQKNGPIVILSEGHLVPVDDIVYDDEKKHVVIIPEVKS